MKYDRNAVKAWAGDSQWRALQADLARFRLSGYTGWGSEGFWALALFRLQKVVNHCGPKWPKWLWMPAVVLLAGGISRCPRHLGPTLQGPESQNGDHRGLKRVRRA